MATQQPIVQVLARAARVIQRTRYSELASSSIIIWDHLATIDQEIELIWKAPWSLGKALFLLNRYYVLFSVIFNNYVLFAPNLSDLFCVNWFRWQGCTGLIACLIAEVILQMRLYALYHLNKKVLVFMCVSFVVAWGASAVIMGLVLSRVGALSHLIPGVPFCVPINVPGWFYTFWIPTLSFETLLCSLALFRAFKDFRSRTSIFQSGRHIVMVLIRDSLIYYLVMFATYFTNLLIFLNGDTSLLETGIGFSVAMSCVMGSRLCLNVRSIHHEMTETEEEIVTQSTRNEWVATTTKSRNSVRVSGSCVLTELEMAELRNLKTDGGV